MAVKDLAIAYNGSKNADTALEFAIQMCRKHKAALTGVYVPTGVRFEGQFERWVSDDLLESMGRAEKEIGQAIEQKFRDQVSAAGLDGPIDWIAEEGRPNLVLARVARHFDLLLIGQFSEPGDSNRPVRAEDLVLTSGTPLIIVPSGYTVRPFTELAVVGWDGSRPAARALSDAMHILETKQRLDVITVGTDPAADGDRPVPDVVTHLTRHGIDARRVSVAAGRAGVGETLLGYCAENEADLLVMGAYSRTRLRENLFGGVTRDVLHHMTVPVLMAH